MDISQNYKRLKQPNYLEAQIANLEVVEVVLVQYNLADNQYQKKSEVLYTFTPNNSYVYLLNVKSCNLVFL